jgi:hypothetical protein
MQIAQTNGSSLIECDSATALISQCAFRVEAYSILAQTSRAEGQTSADDLLNYAAQGGFTIAISNLFLTGNPLVRRIVTHWSQWREGVPQQQDARSARSTIRDRGARPLHALAAYCCDGRNGIHTGVSLFQ